MIEIKTAGGATYANSFEDIAGLSKKLAELATKIGPIVKDGTVEVSRSRSYQYVSYESVAAAMRGALKDAGLSFSLSTSGIERTVREYTDQYNNAKAVTTTVLSVEGVFTDNETGAMRVVQWYGEGQDMGDKSVPKAITGGVKYGLMRMFLFSDRDDVDPDRQEEEPPTKEPPTKKPTRPFSPVVLAQMFSTKLKEDTGEPASAGKRGLTVGALESLFTAKETASDMRHKLTQYLIGQPASAGFSNAECDVLLSWSKDGDAPHPMAIQEAAKVVELVEAEQGQQPLMGDE